MISGRYFDGISAAGIEAALQFDADGMVRVHGARAPIAVALRHIKISERLGNIPRRIQLIDGGVFETHDNDAVDRMRDALGLQRTSAVVHWLESRWQVAVASLAAVVVLSFVFIRWGVPALADYAARVMPTQTDAAIGRGTLNVLDRLAFEETTLSDDRQRQLRDRFARMTQPLDDGHEYALEFRSGDALGANAFALPSGIVVMTDELVELAQSDDELVAVLAHEIGHVRGRHALRQLLQAAGVSVIAVALLGDVSSMSGVLGAAPTLLHAKHSRDFEREADDFAKQWLREHGIAESHFDKILCRLDESHGGRNDLSYLASHPATTERVNCAAN